MAGWLPGALAVGATQGIGTGEEQRQRQDRLMQWGSNLAIQQGHLDVAKGQLAQAAQLHDLQYGPASPEEIRATNQVLAVHGIQPIDEKAGIRRDILNHLAESTRFLDRGEQNVNVDPETGKILGMGRGPLSPTPVPGTGAPGLTVPPEEGQPNIPATSPRMTEPMPGQVYNRWMENRQKGQQAAATAATNAAWNTRLGQARTRFSNKEPMEKILADNPDMDAKDIAGYQLANPTRPAQPQTHFGANGEVIQVTPAGEGTPAAVTTLRKGEPDQGKATTLAERLWQTRRNQAMKWYGNDTANPNGFPAPDNETWDAANIPDADYKLIHGQAKPDLNQVASDRADELTKALTGRDKPVTPMAAKELVQMVLRQLRQERLPAPKGTP